MGAERRAAREDAGRLMVHCQTSAAWVADEIASATAHARASGWTEVEFALQHVEIIRRIAHGIDGASALIDDLERRAGEVSMSAMQAVAIMDRIVMVNQRGDVAPFSWFAHARVLLSDERQPPRDRVSGLVNLAVELDSARMSETADGVLLEARDAAMALSSPDEALSVIAYNRATMGLARIAAMIESDDLVAANTLMSEVREQAASIDAGLVPAAWVSRIDAQLLVWTALLADDDLQQCEVDEMRGVLDDVDADCLSMMELVTPMASWGRTPDLDTRSADRFGTWMLYLYARALDRGNAEPRQVIEAYRAHAVAMSAARCRAATRLEAGLGAMIDAVRLTAERRELVEQALTDPLTGLANRRAYDQRLDERRGEMVTVILGDLDDFKAVNDRFGHAVGDAVLQRAADAVGRMVRGASPLVVSRFGGDEFAVVLPSTTELTSQEAGRRFALAMSSGDWTMTGDVVPTATFGVASGSWGPALLHQADVVLYERKSARARQDATAVLA